jgi:hypothetical protein
MELRVNNGRITDQDQSIRNNRILHGTKLWFEKMMCALLASLIPTLLVQCSNLIEKTAKIQAAKTPVLVKLIKINKKNTIFSSEHLLCNKHRKYFGPAHMVLLQSEACICHVVKNRNFSLDSLLFRHLLNKTDHIFRNF